MSKHAELDDFLNDLTSPRGSVIDASVFFLGLKKLAAQDPVQEAAPPMEAQAPMEAPMEAPGMEPEAAQPMDPVVVMAQCTAQVLKQQLAYLYYAELVRGQGRDEIAEHFKHKAQDEANEASYLLRRISVLTGEAGAALPPIPSPEPLSDIKSILDVLVAGEQQAIVLYKALQAQLGEDPMRYTIEQTLGEAQGHLDRLMQLYPTGGGKKTSASLEIAMKLARVKLAESQRPKPGPQDVVIPDPAEEELEAYEAREKDLALEQAQAENAFLAQRVQDTEGMAMQATQHAENASAQAEMSEQNAVMSSQHADEATMQAQQNAEAATAAEQNAAQQAEAKMRLAMRIQQFRQQLADIAAQDPVQEEGVGFGGEAGPGSPLTGTQQAMEQEQMMQEQEAAAATDPKAKKAPAPKAEAAPAKTAGLFDKKYRRVR